MQSISLMDLSEVVKGKESNDLAFVFEYLAQSAFVELDKDPTKRYRFALWPQFDLPPVDLYSTDQGMDFWLLVSNHWTHQSFLDEGVYYKFDQHAGFICLRCGLRAVIPIHTYVSIQLNGAAARGYNYIRNRATIFEARIKQKLGLPTPPDMVGVLYQSQRDPILNLSMVS